MGRSLRTEFLGLERIYLSLIHISMAKNGWDLLGSWCGHGKDTDVEMLYDGLTAEFGGEAELRYAMGCKPVSYTHLIYWCQSGNSIQVI